MSNTSGLVGLAGPPRARGHRVDAVRSRPFDPSHRGTAPVPGVALAGRYRLAELLGEGSTASVWRARDDVLQRDVAVKWFHGDLALPLAEARMAARVRHPNVAAVHDVVRGDGEWCLVMDYYQDGDLASLVAAAGPLPPATVAAIGLRLLAGLRAVHRAGMVHCDVKPANVLLGADGAVALADFGIAEIAGAGPAHPARRDGRVLGSPGYLAPEVVQGRRPTPAADLWSLGVTLYVALEGRPPFPERDPVETATAVLHREPARSRNAGPLGPLLQRLLVRHPAWRPSHDVVHALLLAAAPCRDCPPPAVAAVDPAVAPLRATREA